MSGRVIFHWRICISFSKNQGRQEGRGQYNQINQSQFFIAGPMYYNLHIEPNKACTWAMLFEQLETFINLWLSFLAVQAWLRTSRTVK